MARQFQLRRGITSEIKEFIGAEGELIYNTQTKELSVHDGVTKGGSTFPILTGGKIPLSQLPTASVQQAGVTVFADTITSNRTDYALTANQGLVLANRDAGHGQTYQNVRGSRVTNTTYTNSTEKLIFISIGTFSDNNTNLDVVINGVSAGPVMASPGWEGARTTTFPIPVGATYRVNGENGQVNTWTEMR